LQSLSKKKSEPRKILKRKRERFLRLIRRARERKERGSAGDKKKQQDIL
jgi:hypothetical protein